MTRSFVADRTVVVSGDGSADYPTITEAVRDLTVKRILIRPGTYHEELVLDRSIELVADGLPGEVILAAPELKSGTTGIKVESGPIVLRGLTIRGFASGIELKQGSLEIDGCTVDGQSNLTRRMTLNQRRAAFERNRGIHVSGGELQLRRTEVRGTSLGIYLGEKLVSAVIEYCHIHTNMIGVSAWSGPMTLRNCQLRNNFDEGICAEAERGPMDLLDCEISGSRQPIRADFFIFSNPLTLLRCRVHEWWWVYLVRVFKSMMSGGVIGFFLAFSLLGGATSDAGLRVIATGAILGAFLGFVSVRWGYFAATVGEDGTMLVGVAGMLWMILFGWWESGTLFAWSTIAGGLIIGAVFGLALGYLLSVWLGTLVGFLQMSISVGRFRWSIFLCANVLFAALLVASAWPSIMITAGMWPNPSRFAREFIVNPDRAMRDYSAFTDEREKNFWSGYIGGSLDEDTEILGHEWVGTVRRRDDQLTTADVYVIKCRKAGKMRYLPMLALRAKGGRLKPVIGQLDEELQSRINELTRDE